MSSNELEGGGGSAGTSGGGTDSDGSSEGSSSGSLTQNRLLGILGISGTVWAALLRFGDRLESAESFRELVVEIILTEFVNGVLSLASYLFSEALFAVDLIAESFWASLVTPFGELYRAFTDLVISPLGALRLSVESGVASAGLGAPFVALAGWIAVILVAAVVLGIVWAIAETYLPTEAVTENAARLLDFAFVPFRVVGRLLRGVVEGFRGESTDGGTNDA